MSQPVRFSAAVSIDVNGIATAKFATPPQGYVWTGSVSVPGATPNSVLPVTWTASAALAPVATWYNAQASGVVQVASGDNISILGVGLAAGSYTAWFVGTQDPGGSAPAVWPQPPPAPPLGQPFVLLNSLFSPIVIPANSGFNLVGGASGIPVPVTLGTSLEISFLNTTANCILIITWPQSTTASGGPSMTFSVGIGSSSPQSGQIEGWVIPNLGPLLQIACLTAGQPTSIEALIQTGLPPISQYPVISNRVLANLNNVSIPAGGNSFVLPPYYGPASITFAPNNTAGVGYSISCADYQNVNQALIQPTQGWPTNTGPHATDSTIYLPPLVNTLEIGNGSGATQTVSVSITVP